MFGNARFIRNKKGLFLEEINSPWREILHKGRKHVFPKGHREVCGGEQFYLIISGLVRLDFMGRVSSSGASLYMGPGCLFNEIPALQAARTSQVGFFCTMPTEAWAFNADLLYDEEFISEYPRLIGNLMQSLAEKTSELFLYLMYARGASSLSRICATLLHLTNNERLKMAQCEMAMMLGLHPTTVARHMRHLREEGIIGTFTKNRLEVLDLPALQKLAEL